MRSALLAMIAALAGCSIIGPEIFGIREVPVDALDPSDSPTSCSPFASNVDVCDANLVRSGPWHITAGVSIKTGATPSVSDGTPIQLVDQLASSTPMAVIAVDSLVIDPGVVVGVQGGRPLVIVVYDTATIDGTIQITPATGGAGCATGDGASGANGSGGGGGGYGTVGGAGGRPTAGTGGGGGPVVTDDGTLVPIRIGCSGGKAGSVGPAGAGGGALQISVQGTLSFGGVVSAGGGGGAAGSAGAPGGGSGGSILLEAASIVIDTTGDPTPRLCANGGAGGGTGAGGAAGPDGSCDQTLGPARSPTGPVPGGDGAAENFPAQPGLTGGSVGGGGGGGVGRIRINGPISGGLVRSSPQYLQ